MFLLVMFLVAGHNLISFISLPIVSLTISLVREKLTFLKQTILDLTLFLWAIDILTVVL